MNEKTNEKWFVRAVCDDGVIILDSVYEGYQALISMDAIRCAFATRADIGEEHSPARIATYSFSRIA